MVLLQTFFASSGGWPLCLSSTSSSRQKTLIVLAGSSLVLLLAISALGRRWPAAENGGTSLSSSRRYRSAAHVAASSSSSLFYGPSGPLPIPIPSADGFGYASVRRGGSGGEGNGKGDGSDLVVFRVFQPHPSVAGVADEARIRADLRRMRATVLTDDLFLLDEEGGGGAPANSAATIIEHVVADLEGMRSFLEKNGSRCYTPDDSATKKMNAKKRKGKKGRASGKDDVVDDDGDDEGGANPVLRRFDRFLSSHHPHLATELWKYCSLFEHGGAYLDSSSPLLSTFRDSFLDPLPGGNGGGGVAVLGDSVLSYSRSTVHGSFLLLPRPRSTVAREMVRLLVGGETAGNLAKDPLIVPRKLYALIVEDCGMTAPEAKREVESEGNEEGENGGGGGALHPGSNGPNGEWTLLSMRCRGGGGANGGGELATGSHLALMEGVGLGNALEYRVAHQCPKRGGYCCEVIDDTSDDAGVVLMTRHPLMPYEFLPPSRDLPKPYRLDKHGESDGSDAAADDASVLLNAPFIATIREEVMPKPPDGKVHAAPNFFDFLLANDCLPSDKFCSQCLRNKKGATCETCKKVCPCYCNALCKTEVEAKFVSKRVTVTPPAYRRDPSRLVPRIVHQTWFEDVTKEKYPNMSRLIESWKRSGWEYRFYSDAAAQEYLSTHFPPEIREAYDAIKPGAFKADLFRYCVLLIDGGVYADMDVLLEANLDAAVPGDVGFMTPLDEPGMAAGHRMCLWNGLIASAPGHPFLAKVIETVVNNIRNRFTSVDVDNMLCPDPELSVAHSFDILFTAGPCMLGMSINNLLGRHPQTSFEAGDVDPWAQDRIGSTSDNEDALFSVRPDDPRLHIPGRTVILNQNKWDMGAHRFTWEEQNLVVAATDMPDYDDRDKLEGNVHYSDTHVKFGIYGLEKLYIDREIAFEDIKLVVARIPDERNVAAKK